MKVRMLTSVAGPEYSYGPGEHDMPDEIATELLNAGHAESVAEPVAEPVAERTQKATAKRGETATVAKADEE